MNNSITLTFLPNYTVEPKSNEEETSNKPKLRSILQNKLPIIFKNSNIKKVKERTIPDQRILKKINMTAKCSISFCIEYFCYKGLINGTIHKICIESED